MPKGIPLVTGPHFMACYSLLLSTAAIDSLANFCLLNVSEPYRSSDFLLQGNSVTRFQKLKAMAWNGLLVCGTITVSTALAYPAEVKWRRFVVSVDEERRNATVRDIWKLRHFRGTIWVGFWASCLRNAIGSTILNYRHIQTY